MLRDSPDERAALVLDALDKAAEQPVRAGDVIQRLRDFVSRGETERRIESIKKLVEEASALALVAADVRAAPQRDVPLPRPRPSDTHAPKAAPSEDGKSDAREKPAILCWPLAPTRTWMPAPGR